jgi:hypothetical protein
MSRKRAHRFAPLLNKIVYRKVAWLDRFRINNQNFSLKINEKAHATSARSVNRRLAHDIPQRTTRAGGRRYIAAHDGLRVSPSLSQPASRFRNIRLVPGILGQPDADLAAVPPDTDRMALARHRFQRIFEGKESRPCLEADRRQTAARFEDMARREFKPQPNCHTVHRPAVADEHPIRSGGVAMPQ